MCETPARTPCACWRSTPTGCASSCTASRRPPTWTECNARGYFQSYAGNLTFANAADLRAAAARTREDLLLVETDAPFLTPVPWRGKPNRPALVKHTAAVLAQVRGWETAEAAALTSANARRAFALAEAGS